jgi:hypothetical protein
MNKYIDHHTIQTKPPDEVSSGGLLDMYYTSNAKNSYISIPINHAPM